MPTTGKRAPSQLSAELRTILRCTKCGAAVQEGAEEYRCVSCGKTFPAVRGVYRFVEQQNYAASFGWQWQRYAKTQLDTTGGTISDEAFRKRTGIRPEELEGKLILDVGCGMGRFAEVATRWGARVVGIDLSAACEVAARNLGERDFVALQADVMELPFAPGEFRLHLQHRRAAPHSGLRTGLQELAAIFEAWRDDRHLAVQRVQQVVPLQRYLPEGDAPDFAADAECIFPGCGAGAVSPGSGVAGDPAGGQAGRGRCAPCLPGEPKSRAGGAAAGHFGLVFAEVPIQTYL